MFAKKDYLTMLENEYENILKVPNTKQAEVSIMKKMLDKLKEDDTLLGIQIDAINAYAVHVPDCTIQEARTMSSFINSTPEEIEYMNSALGDMF